MISLTFCQQDHPAIYRATALKRRKLLAIQNGPRPAPRPVGSVSLSCPSPFAGLSLMFHRQDEEGVCPLAAWKEASLLRLEYGDNGFVAWVVAIKAFHTSLQEFLDMDDDLSEDFVAEVMRGIPVGLVEV